MFFSIFKNCTMLLHSSGAINDKKFMLQKLYSKNTR